MRRHVRERAKRERVSMRERHGSHVPCPKMKEKVVRR